jgi:hypothetical protein
MNENQTEGDVDCGEEKSKQAETNNYLKSLVLKRHFQSIAVSDTTQSNLLDSSVTKTYLGHTMDILAQ